MRWLPFFAAIKRQTSRQNTQIKRSASRAPNETVCEKGEERPGSVSAVIDVEEASTVVSVKNTCGHEEKSLPHIAFTAPNIQSKILSTLLRIGCT